MITPASKRRKALRSRRCLDPRHIAAAPRSGAVDIMTTQITTPAHKPWANVVQLKRGARLSVAQSGSLPSNVIVEVGSRELVETKVAAFLERVDILTIVASRVVVQDVAYRRLIITDRSTG